MTREKEIEQAMKDSVAATIYASGWGATPQATDLLECAFTKGAEWADENPQFSKEEFIEKAAEWISDNVYLYVSNLSGTVFEQQLKEAIKRSIYSSNGGIIMKFTSQIATTRKQSERLIALGVNVGTADCHAFQTIRGLVYKSGFDLNLYSRTGRGGNYFPAWSLHRLIEMAETRLRFWPSGMVEEDELEKYYNKGNYFDNIIDLIARLIEDRYFKEEYLNK